MSPNPDIRAFRSFVAGGVPMDLTSNPLLQALGARLIAHDDQARTVELEFTPGAMFLQGAGRVQGGAVAAILDFAMAFASFAVLGDNKMAVTAAMSTQFCASAADGPLTAFGKVDKPGRAMIFTSATLHQGNRLIATGSSTLAVIDV